MVFLPPSVQELVPAGYLAHFVRDLVRDSLDVSAILKPYTEDRGFSPYDPMMMTALLLYAYSQGLYASRPIAKACEERVDFMVGTAESGFSHDQRRSEAASPGAGRAIHASASAVPEGGTGARGPRRIGWNEDPSPRLQTYSEERQPDAQTAEPGLAAEVVQWLAQAAASDAQEDTAYGVDRRGDELPEWVTNKQHCWGKVRAAKAALEADARDKKRTVDPPSDRPQCGRPAKNLPDAPHDRTQYNFTDLDSRMMKVQDGFIQGYHAQAAVDAAHQVIVAQGLTNQASDTHQLEPMLASIKASMGRQAQELSADAGYGSEHNLTAFAHRHVRGYVATGRQ